MRWILRLLSFLVTLVTCLFPSRHARPKMESPGTFLPAPCGVPQKAMLEAILNAHEKGAAAIVQLKPVRDESRRIPACPKSVKRKSIPKGQDGTKPAELIGKLGMHIADSDRVQLFYPFLSDATTRRAWHEGDDPGLYELSKRYFEWERRNIIVCPDLEHLAQIVRCQQPEQLALGSGLRVNPQLPVVAMARCAGLGLDFKAIEKATDADLLSEAALYVFDVPGDQELVDVIITTVPASLRSCHGAIVKTAELWVNVNAQPYYTRWWRRLKAAPLCFSHLEIEVDTLTDYELFFLVQSAQQISALARDYLCSIDARRYLPQHIYYLFNKRFGKETVWMETAGIYLTLRYYLHQRTDRRLMMQWP